MRARCLLNGVNDVLRWPFRALLVVSAISVAAASAAFAVGYERALHRAVSTFIGLAFGGDRTFYVHAILHPIHGQKPRPLALEEVQAMREEFNDQATFQGGVVGEILLGRSS